MAKAQAEFLEKTGHHSSITEMVKPEVSTNGQAYRLDGVPATEDTRGIIIKEGKKIVRN